jgi:outer membrane receptor protein involved in Fe transport
MALLPAVSLVYGLTDQQNLRASWTRTFSFPEYREMAPLLFYSYEDAVETVGNTDLKPTDIYNYDARWEWFLSGSEMIAASAFYKQFTNPVELRIQEATSNLRADYANAPSATLYGLEGEVRVGLDRIHELLLPFQLVANYTWIHSEVEGLRKRTLQGQSPYLVNLILFYEGFNGATQMSLLYNEFGRRLAKVGAGTFPDVYEQSRGSLEFAWTQKFSKNIKSKFTARNLTGPEVVQTQGGLVTRRVKTVPGFSLGVSYAY